MISAALCRSLNVVVLREEEFIASLKVAVMTAREHTPVAPLAGVTETTVGGDLHPLAAVLKLHTKFVSRELPKASTTAELRAGEKTRSNGPGHHWTKKKMVLLTS